MPAGNGIRVGLLPDRGFSAEVVIELQMRKIRFRMPAKTPGIEDDRIVHREKAQGSIKVFHDVK